MNYERLALKAYDPHFSLESVSRHDRSREEFETYAKLAVRRAVEHGPHAKAELSPYLFKWASDPRLLRGVWGRLARSGGPAPGPNGRRYSDLCDHEVWSLLKSISMSVRGEAYKPQRARRIWVPKDPLQTERGYRPISLINVEDRVLQRAIVELLGPLREPQWDDNIFGSRSRRSRLHALARLERLATETKRWVWIADDLRDAFESVPRSRLRDVLLKSVPGEKLVELIIRLIDNGQKHGVQQGGPLGPYMLIEYLHHFLCGFWRKVMSAIPLLLYVDDLLALCKTKKEAREAWQELHQRLVAAGMELKGKEPICDLRKGESVVWLGFSLSRADNGLRVRIASTAWSRLQGKLILAHEQPNAPLRAIDMIEGWIDQIGPTYEFENRTAVLNRLTRMAKTLGFDEIPSTPALRARWHRAHQRWQEIRTAELKPEPPEQAATPALAIPTSSVSDDATPPFDVMPVKS